jgi:organic radical activating enzyme
MEKILGVKHDYDTAINWILTDVCNFKCEYCFNEKRKHNSLEPIDIEKAIETLRKTKRRYFITLAGGEPFLIPNFIDLCKTLTREHYIVIITNLSCTQKIEQFVKEISPERAYIHASCHVMAHESLGITDFSKNYSLLKNNNFCVKSDYVVYPPLLPRFEQDITYYRSKGVDLVAKEFSGYYKSKNYPDSYTENDKKRLYKYGADGKGYLKAKGTQCNAGYNSIVVDSKGDVFPCHFVPIKLGNIYKKINFNSKMLVCPIDFCICPLKSFEPRLFSYACQNTKSYSPMEQKFLLGFSRRIKFCSTLKQKFLLGFSIEKNFDLAIGQVALIIKKVCPSFYYKLKKLKKE